MLTTYRLIQGDSVLLAQPLLIHHYGRVGALLIQQIHYWSQKGQGTVHNNQRWIYNTVDQWAEQLCVSASTIKRAVQKLLKDGILQVQKLSKHKSNQTNSYTLNHERLMALVETQLNAQNHENDSCDQEDFCALETSTKAHGVKMTSSPDQSGPMVIQRITYKDNNKSERLTPQDYVPTYHQTNVEKEEDSHTLIPMTDDNPNGRVGQGKQCIVEVQKTPNSKAKTVAQDMIDVWNDKVSLNKKTNNIKLNREISKYLIASYKYKFNENLDDWKQYCDVITSSSYLMADAFNLSLTWALKFGTIDRLLAGELGVKLKASCMSQIPAKSLDEGRAEAIRHIDGVGESQGCKDVRRMILAALGPVQYNAWFTKVDVLDDGRTLRPHNRFVEAAIAARFGDVMERVGR